MQLNLNHKHWETMRQHLESCSPLEACGLLAGKDSFVREVFLIANQAQSTVRFRMDPIEQLKAFDRMETAGLDLLAIFHSHPFGPETMSATDIAEAAYPVVQIIWSRSNPHPTGADLQPAEAWRARGFRIENGKAIEVTLQIMDYE
jgi:proteasome lid subunit RPN8/RPN11